MFYFWSCCCASLNWPQRYFGRWLLAHAAQIATTLLWWWWICTHAHAHTHTEFSVCVPSIVCVCVCLRVCFGYLSTISQTGNAPFSILIAKIHNATIFENSMQIARVGEGAFSSRMKNRKTTTIAKRSRKILCTIIGSYAKEEKKKHLNPLSANMARWIYIYCIYE